MTDYDMKISRTKEEDPGYDVFLSHSSADRDVAHDIARRLKSDGLRVWFEVWELRPNDPLKSVETQVQTALRKSKIQILLASRTAFGAEWPRLEQQTFLFRDPGRSGHRFIPIKIDDYDFVDSLRHFSYIDWSTKNPQAYEALLQFCRSALESKSMAPARVVYAQKAIRATDDTEGHGGAILSVAITPDGKMIVSGSSDHTIRLWNRDGGKWGEVLRGHEGYVYAVAVTPDGKHVVSGSRDRTLKVWDLETQKCVATLAGHLGSVFGLALSADGKRVISASEDRAVRIWDLASLECISVLDGHTDEVWGVAVTSDNRWVLSAARDRTIRKWDLSSGTCEGVLHGHAEAVLGVAITPSNREVISVSDDRTIRVWDLESGARLGTFEGHYAGVNRISIFPNGHYALSGSDDRTARVWDIESGRCLAILRGHDDRVWGIAAAPDGRQVVSGSSDKSIRIWPIPRLTSVDNPNLARYTNAKVVLVGKTGVGKTGLAIRMAENRWESTSSTDGVWATQLRLPQHSAEVDTEKEVWLWDFAGQADYRLIHQMYMDETAVAVLVFNPQDDNPFEDLDIWDKAISTSIGHVPRKLLVAGRCDRGGVTVSRERFEEFCRSHGFSDLISTSAKTGDGCDLLREAIFGNIQWERIPWISTTRLFKLLKDAILHIKDQGLALIRFAELRQRLQMMFPSEAVEEQGLRAVVGLLSGQGIVWKLDFGDFVLLQPEQINIYVSSLVRAVRSHTDEIGCIDEYRIFEGDLAYADMSRLDKSDEEILLRAMHQMLIKKSICIREHTDVGALLIFPSYFKKDRPDLLAHPSEMVSYRFSGAIDEIYSTLVVKLHHTPLFEKDQLWRNAADFKTPGGRRLGLKLTKRGGVADIVVYFDSEVSDDVKVAFVKYVHEHLKAKDPNVVRVRHYVCPKCGNPVEGKSAIERRMQRGLRDIACPDCEERISLFDLIEEKLASSEFLQKVRQMEEAARTNIDNESRELILIGHAFSIAGEAGQIFRPTSIADWGIDGEIEFKNDNGEASGKRLYLQLKSGDSYLHRREVDGREIFVIKNRRHIRYWQEHEYPVMLVIRSSDGNIRWMNITEYLRRQDKPSERVVFAGEPFTALNLSRLRDRVLRSTFRGPKAM